MVSDQYKHPRMMYWSYQRTRNIKNKMEIHQLDKDLRSFISYMKGEWRLQLQMEEHYICTDMENIDIKIIVHRKYWQIQNEKLTPTNEMVLINGRLPIKILFKSKEINEPAIEKDLRFGELALQLIINHASPTEKKNIIKAFTVLRNYEDKDEDECQDQDLSNKVSDSNDTCVQKVGDQLNDGWKSSYAYENTETYDTSNEDEEEEEEDHDTSTAAAATTTNITTSSSGGFNELFRRGKGPKSESLREELLRKKPSIFKWHAKLKKLTGKT
jgi:hypothetical protein